jgi:hypothetical protein
MRIDSDFARLSQEPEMLEIIIKSQNPGNLMMISLC